MVSVNGERTHNNSTYPMLFLMHGKKMHVCIQYKREDEGRCSPY